MAHVRTMNKSTKKAEPKPKKLTSEQEDAIQKLVDRVDRQVKSKCRDLGFAVKSPIVEYFHKSYSSLDWVANHEKYRNVLRPELVQNIDIATYDAMIDIITTDVEKSIFTVGTYFQKKYLAGDVIRRYAGSMFNIETSDIGTVRVCYYTGELNENGSVVLNAFDCDDSTPADMIRYMSECASALATTIVSHFNNSDFYESPLATSSKENRVTNLTKLYYNCLVAVSDDTASMVAKLSDMHKMDVDERSEFQKQLLYRINLGTLRFLARTTIACGIHASSAIENLIDPLTKQDENSPVKFVSFFEITPDNKAANAKISMTIAKDDENDDGYGVNFEVTMKDLMSLFDCEGAGRSRGTMLAKRLSTLVEEACLFMIRATF